MTELQNEALPDDRGITPVGTGDNGRTAMLKRGFGALALTAFAFLDHLGDLERRQAGQ